MNDDVRDTDLTPVGTDDLVPSIYGDWDAAVNSSLCDTVAMEVIDKAGATALDLADDAVDDVGHREHAKVPDVRQDDVLGPGQH